MAERGEALSDRELDVLRRMAAGESNKAIADGLSISPYTVKTHLRNIYIKLDVSTRTEAMTVALQQGVLSVGNVDEPSTNGRESAGDQTAVAVSESITIDNPTAGIIPSATPDFLPAATAAPPVVSHRWRNLSLIMIALFALVLGAFLFIQWQSGELFATTAEPFEEIELGESRWLSSRPLPEPRAGRAAAAVGLDVYIIGGETEGGVTGDTRVFDTRERTWRRAAAKPTAVTDATAADLFGEIYVPGGSRADGQPTAIVEAYSPSQNAWRRVAPLPRPVAGALAVADGGFLYVFGGRDEDGPLDTAFVYDPGADSWRPIAALPESLADAAGGALTGLLYVVGGDDENGPTDTCVVYDPAVDAWEECPAMLRPRAGAGATVLLNKLYVIGGESSTGTSDPSVPAHGEVFDPNTQTWNVLTTPPGVTASTRVSEPAGATTPPGMAGWSDPGVTHVETRIYALGGRMGEALSDGNLVYAPLVYQTFIPAAPSSGDE